MKNYVLMMPMVGMLGLSIVGLSGCDDSEQTNAQAPTLTPHVNSTPPAKVSTADDNRQSPKTLVEYAWPNIDDTEQVTVAENILASNYYVILDGSGSMAGKRCSGGKTKMRAAKNALTVFSAALASDANLGMLAFDVKGISERLPLGDKNRNIFIQKVNEVSAQSGTPLKSALKQAFKKLTEQGKKQLGYGEYHLVVVTDGDASSGENPVAIVNEIYQESPVILHTIGFCIDEKHSLNQQGKAYYKAADNPKALQAGLDNVLAELDSFSVSEFSQ